MSVTDLHQQGADHRVDSARVGDGGHLVATQYVGLQGLCADLQIHLTCVHTDTVFTDSRAVLIAAPCHSVTFCVRRQNSFSVGFSIQLIIFPAPPSLLLPMCPMLFVLINPHLLPYYTASPPYSHPSLPSFLHSPQSFTEDKYRSPPEGAVSDCFVRDTT